MWGAGYASALGGMTLTLTRLAAFLSIYLWLFFVISRLRIHLVAGIIMSLTMEDDVRNAPDTITTLLRPCEDHKLLSLPAEIRIAILEYVFEDNLLDDGFRECSTTGTQTLDPDYSANAKLMPLFTCRQMYEDGTLLAMRRTSFVVQNLFFNIPERLATLHPKQVGAVRSITFVADDRHFRKLLSWGQCPFGMPDLQLDTLTIVLHRSSHYHYLFDFTSDIVKLLRQLGGVRRLVFVRNNALVKGSLKAWSNRLIGLIMKVDHHERYNVNPANPENIWWTWGYDDTAQSFCMEACPAKPVVDEESYIHQIKPIMEALKDSVENEEWNPDPRSRNGF